MPPLNGKRRLIAGCLTGVAVSLLLVGLVSGTFIRHVVQIVPILVVLPAVLTRRRWAAYAAIPLFAIWLPLMGLIWLYLVGVTTLFTGTFSRTEIVLTIVIGLCALVGIPSSGGSKGIRGLAARAGIVAASAGLQVAALWVRFLEPFVNR
jgi:hypothetical protein